MALFRPLPSDDDSPGDVPEQPGRGDRARWRGPPLASFSGVVPLQRVIARTPESAVVLVEFRAYSEGCLLDVIAAARLPGPPSAAWENGERLIKISQPPRPGEPLSPHLLRFAVRLPDGRVATTIDSSYHSRLSSVQDSLGLIALNGSGHYLDTLMEYQQPLWLCPVPPPTEFQLVVEWPVYGIDETSVVIDGGAVAAAAAETSPYW